MKRYFLLSLKRLTTALPTLLTVISVLLLFGAVALLSYFGNKEEEVRAIGLVGNTEDSYVRMAAALLSEAEGLDAVFLDEDEAKEKLLDEKLQGYAVIPDDFISSAMKGKNIPFSYYLLKKPSALSHMLTGEIVSSVSVLLTESQRAVYGMRQLLRDEGLRDRLSEETEGLSFRLVSVILERDKLFEESETGDLNSLSTLEGFTVSGMLIFALTLGICLAPYLVKRDLSLSRLLSSMGISPAVQVLLEWCAFALFILIFTSAVMLLLSLFFPVFELSLLPRTIPALLLLSALQFFVYEISTSVVAGILLQFFSSFTLAYLSGYFYPSYLFPDSVTNIAKYLPTAVAIRSVGEGVLTLLLYLLLLLSLSVAVRLARTKRGGL